MSDKEKDTTNVADAALLKMPLPVNRLLPGFRIPFDVYMKEDETLVHLFNKWTLFNKETKDILNDKGITTVYIEGTLAKIEDYLKDASQARPEVVDTKKFYDYSIKKDAYLSIDKTILVDRKLFVKNTKITFSIFLVSDMLFQQLAEASPDRPVEIPDTVFKTRGDLAIRIDDVQLYKEYLDSVLASPDIPVNMKQKSKAILLKENSKILVREVLSSTRLGEKMDEVGAAIGELTDSVLNKQVSVSDLMSLKNHDLYTYTHSVNVTVMFIAICAALGFEKGLIEKIGVGAIMHDIGKSTLPPNVLNKLGKLTNDEFAVMKTHVVQGVKMLEDNKDVTKEALVVVLQHHDRLSG